MIIGFVASLAVFAGEEKALVIASGSQAASCISPMLIKNVDGKEMAGALMQIELEPGKHTISGPAQIDTSFCSRVGISRGGKKNALKPLEVELEAGKTYYIGVNHKASRESGWFYEVWKVEDSK